MSWWLTPPNAFRRSGRVMISPLLFIFRVSDDVGELFSLFSDSVAFWPEAFLERFGRGSCFRLDIGDIILCFMIVAKFLCQDG